MASLLFNCVEHQKREFQNSPHFVLKYFFGQKEICYKNMHFLKKLYHGFYIKCTIKAMRKN